MARTNDIRFLTVFGPATGRTETPARAYKHAAGHSFGQGTNRQALAARSAPHL
jgi:hypothetical protein